jgi:hypothetical protein
MRSFTGSILARRRRRVRPRTLDRVPRGILAQAALLALPGALACVFYNAWSTKGSLVFFGVVTAAALAGFVVWAGVGGRGARAWRRTALRSVERQ